MYLRYDVGANRPRSTRPFGARNATGSTARFFRHVDPVTAEHRVDPVTQIRLCREAHEQLQRLFSGAVLRVVEMMPHASRLKTFCPLRIGANRSRRCRLTTPCDARRARATPVDQPRVRHEPSPLDDELLDVGRVRFGTWNGVAGVGAVERSFGRGGGAGVLRRARSSHPWAPSGPGTPITRHRPDHARRILVTRARRSSMRSRPTVRAKT
jgi:hypothetical protein